MDITLLYIHDYLSCLLFTIVQLSLSTHDTCSLSLAERFEVGLLPCIRAESSLGRCYQTNHHLIGVLSLYPFWCFSHEKTSTPFTPFKWWFVINNSSIVKENLPFKSKVI